MNRVSLKRGDTLEITVKLLNDDGTPEDITNYEIRMQGRDSKDNLVFNLFEGGGILKDDPQNGIYTILIQDTSNFPIGTLKTDIQYKNGTNIKSTDTFYINVLEDITR